MIPLCARADLYAFGLPRGAVPNPGRLAAGVSVATNAIALGEHGFAADDPVSFRAEAGGALPAPIVDGTTYFAKPLTDSAFSVSATVGGAVIDLVNAGLRVIVIAPLPIDAAIAWAGEIIANECPAHVLPFVAPVPEIVRMTAAELAAGKLGLVRGAVSKTLAQTVDAAQKRIARWALGVPIRGENAPGPASLATSGATVDRRGWSRFGAL